MKINELEVLLLKCPPPRGYPHPAASFVYDGSLLLRVHTDEGISGLGEPSPYGGTLGQMTQVIQEQLAPRLKGKDPFDVSLLTTQKDFPGGVGYGNIPYNCALAAVSQALWDIVGKASNSPVCRLLNRNGTGKTRVRAYASGGMSYESQDPQVLIDEVLRCKEEGYTAWKLRPPTASGASHLERNRRPPPVDLDRFLSLLERIRCAVGEEMELMVDMGCRLRTFDEALTFMRSLEELRFSFCEEPLPRVAEEYARLAEAVELPIAAGECLVSRGQFRSWLDQRALDIIQPDGNVAGPTEIMEIASMAAGRGVPCVIHNWAGAVSVAANVHLALSIPNCRLIEHNITYNPLSTLLVDRPFIPRNGHYELTEKPGLGVELNEDAVRRFAVQP